MYIYSKYNNTLLSIEDYPTIITMSSDGTDEVLFDLIAYPPPREIKDDDYTIFAQGISYDQCQKCMSQIAEGIERELKIVILEAVDESINKTEES